MNGTGILAALATGAMAWFATVLALFAGPPLLSQVSGRVEATTVQQGQVTRYYRLYRPANVAPHPGLVIDLHGAGTSGLTEAN